MIGREVLHERVEQKHAGQQMRRTAPQQRLDAVAADDVPQALRLSRQRASGPARILICGSLYLAGHVLALQGVTVR